MIKFSDCKIGDNNVEIYALVENFSKRTTPNNAGYYSASLTDGEQTVDARAWSCEIFEANNVKVGNVYCFTVDVTNYNNKAQYKITNLRSVDDNEVNLDSFVKSAPISQEELMRGIAEYTKKIKNKTLYDLVVKLIKENKTSYFEYPAAVTMHHNFKGGLSYHALSMLHLADALLDLYPGMNSDLLYAGIIIHDIGKTKELSGYKATTYTEDGNLLGHIVIGLQLLAVAAKEEGVSDTEEVRALSHLIASHHGEGEFGSPKEPGMMEAQALHLLDLLDSRMASFSPEVVKTKKGSYTSPISTINRKSLYVPNIKSDE